MSLGRFLIISLEISLSTFLPVSQCLPTFGQYYDKAVKIIFE